MGLAEPADRVRRPSMSATWKRLDRLLKKLAPAIFNDLAPASKLDPISDLERIIRRELPDEVKQSLLYHDGQRQGATGCIFNNSLLSVAEIGHHYQSSRGLDPDAVPQSRIRSFPKGTVQLCETHPGWIPLVADCNGNYIGVDLAPDLGGVRGQVIVFGRSESYHYVLADSWASFLADYADDLQDGHFELVVHDDPEFPEFRYYVADGDVIQAVGNRLIGED